MMTRSPGFTLVAIITIALGIGANTAIFSVVNTVLLRPLPYEDPDRLMVIWEKQEQVDKESPSLPNFLDWRERTQSFEDTVREYLQQELSNHEEDLRAAVLARAEALLGEVQA